MNTKKWSKWLSLSIGLAGFAILPIVSTACSSTSQTEEVKAPVVKKDVTTYGAIDKIIIDSNFKNSEEIFKNEFNKNPEVFIENYDLLTNEQKSNISITFNNKENKTVNEGTGNDYPIWSQNATVVKYNGSNSKITVSSFDDLKTYLTNEVLKKIFSDAGIQESETGVDYQVVNESKIYYNPISGIVHINIQKINDSKQIEINPNNFDLQIPATSLIFLFEPNQIEITLGDGSKISSNEAHSLKYHIGVNSEYAIKFNNNNVALENTSDINAILKELKWMDSNGEYLNNVIADDLNLHNCEFANAKLINNEANNTISIELDVTPKNDAFWANGANKATNKTTTLKTGEIQIKNTQPKITVFNLESNEVKEFLLQVDPELKNINDIAFLITRTSQANTNTFSNLDAQNRIQGLFNDFVGAGYTKVDVILKEGANRTVVANIKIKFDEKVQVTGNPKIVGMSYDESSKTLSYLTDMNTSITY